MTERPDQSVCINLNFNIRTFCTVRTDKKFQSISFINRIFCLSGKNFIHSGKRNYIRILTIQCDIKRLSAYADEPAGNGIICIGYLHIKNILTAKRSGTAPFSVVDFPVDNGSFFQTWNNHPFRFECPVVRLVKLIVKISEPQNGSIQKFAAYLRFPDCPPGNAEFIETLGHIFRRSSFVLLINIRGNILCDLLCLCQLLQRISIAGTST